MSLLGLFSSSSREHILKTDLPLFYGPSFFYFLQKEKGESGGASEINKMTFFFTEIRIKPLILIGFCIASASSKPLQVNAHLCSPLIELLANEA